MTFFFVDVKDFVKLCWPSSRDLVSNFCRSSLKYYPSVSESHQATLIPVRQSDTRAGIPNREDEDEEDEPPEGKHAKVKRRSVLSGFIGSRNSSFFLHQKQSEFTLHHGCYLHLKQTWMLENSV